MQTGLPGSLTLSELQVCFQAAFMLAVGGLWKDLIGGM
jgi:hypothetical protein